MLERQVSRIRIAMAGVFGLFLWLVTEWIAAAGLGGGGHGWLGPAFLSLPLLVLYPLAMIRTFARDVRMEKLDGPIVFAAFALDLFLFGNAFYLEDDIFQQALHMGADVVITWAVLWAVWQVLAVVSLVRSHASTEPH